MSSLLIKNAKILDTRSPHHGKRMDVFVDKGIVGKIGQGIKTKADKVVESPNLCLSIGWFDLGTWIGDPGFEYKEDFDSGLKSAAHGGFTEIATMPDVSPVVDSNSKVTYAKNRSVGNLVTNHPIGALTKGCAGEELAELYDMESSGAVAFSDNLNPIHNTELQKLGLLYTKNLKSRILSFSMDQHLSKNGQMHEGSESTSLGLKGVPSIAEELPLTRDLELLEYTGSKLHVLYVSSAAALSRIKAAKRKGQDVTCGVAVANLAFNASNVDGFDTNYKVLPPLRSETDRKALVKGLVDGTIDVISSGHRPHETESKRCEFELAESGMATLEVFLPLLSSALTDKELEGAIDAITITPRSILGLESPVIEEGSTANLTLFDTRAERDNQFKSKAVNYPELNGAKGKVLGVIRGSKQRLF